MTFKIIPGPVPSDLRNCEIHETSADDAVNNWLFRLLWRSLEGNLNKDVRPVCVNGHFHLSASNELFLSIVLVCHYLYSCPCSTCRPQL